jgi:cytochrome c-type biogenesis protein CcmH
MKRRSLLTLCATLALLLVTVSVAGAQGPSDDEVNDVAKDLFCPVCESTPLDVCPTQACEDWRGVIRTQLTDGRSKEEIMDYFALQYGDKVLAEPPRAGFTLFVWLMPVLFVGIGALVFGRYMLRIRTAGRADDTPDAGPTPAAAPAPRQPVAPLEHYVRQIEAELRDAT